MVSEIKSVGAQNLQGMTLAAPVGPGQALPPAEIQPPNIPEAGLPAGHTAFAALASVKDEAAHMASSARQAREALQRAEATVQMMREKVQQFLVKNFPPFPPGSEQRLDYLNSIYALRRQLESMSFPPIERGPEPVFYPREWVLPVFDPQTASDEAIRGFGLALDNMAGRISAGYSELEAIVGELPSWLPLQLPPPPQSDEQALHVSRAVARRLTETGAALLPGSAGLLQAMG